MKKLEIIDGSFQFYEHLDYPSNYRASFLNLSGFAVSCAILLASRNSMKSTSFMSGSFFVKNPTLAALPPDVRKASGLPARCYFLIGGLRPQDLGHSPS
jgi:hypothetical protein